MTLLYYGDMEWNANERSFVSSRSAQDFIAFVGSTLYGLAQKGCCGGGEYYTSHTRDVLGELV